MLVGREAKVGVDMSGPVDHPWCAAGIGAGAAAGYAVARRRRRGQGSRRVRSKGPPPSAGRRRHAKIGRGGRQTMRAWPGWRSASEQHDEQPSKE
ncbi:hypothetical protein [Pseudonocardia spinosispora]|uniref:hypothetical protein n=1 Tax=Pseudonocardia spinosispora TaxID=103441 RepID=UPI0012EB9129|nr:hypothetical protein [Pseudonocardia spinosispora]